MEKIIGENKVQVQSRRQSRNDNEEEDFPFSRERDARAMREEDARALAA